MRGFAHWMPRLPRPLPTSLCRNGLGVRTLDHDFGPSASRA